MTRKLLPNHDVWERFHKLQEYATQLGISLEGDSGSMAIRVEGDSNVYRVVDIDNPEYPMSEFPLTQEYKITYETE